MPERDPALMAALEAEAKAKERIASREQHEGVLNEMIEDLRAKGYFREGESAVLSFPTPENLTEWLGNGVWPKGYGKAVARIEERALLSPPEDAARFERLGSTKDPMGAALKAKGYVANASPDWDSMDADSFTQYVYIYEKEA